MALNYQKVLCVGDSQTFGARSAAGYPEYLSGRLERETKAIHWLTVNEGINGEKTLQVLRRTDWLSRQYQDVFIFTLLCGTNDVRDKTRTDPSMFRMLYRQLLVKWHCERGFLFPATIPIPVGGFGTIPYAAEAPDWAREINCVVRELVKELGIEKYLVELDTVFDGTEKTAQWFEDAVHFNDTGCEVVADLFAKRILERCV